MPTVKQLQAKLKKEVQPTQVTRVLDVTTYQLGKETDDKKIEILIDVWDNPHPVLKVRPEDEGKHVWVAGYPSTWDVILHKYHAEGEDEQFPEGGAELVIKDRRAKRGINTRKDCFFEEIILHPESLDEERLEEYFTVQDGRKV